MPSDDSRPLSEIPLEELKDKLQALRARRAQPRGTSAARTPGIVGPGETTARRGGGGSRKVEVDDPGLMMALERAMRAREQAEGTPDDSQ